MLKDAKQCHDIERAAFPEAESQVTRTYIKAQLLAECGGQSVAVLNRFDIPACAVCGVEEISSPTTNLQKLVSVSKAPQTPQATPCCKLTKHLP